MELKKVFDRFFSNRSDEGAQEQEESSGGQKVFQAKFRIAAHPESKPWCLRRLARHQCHAIVVRVAENPNTSVETLEELARHQNCDVRIALTENLNTPPRVLLLLASDEAVDVRYSLAENHNLPISVLSVLCEDENPYVSSRAYKTLNRLRQSTNNSFVWFPIVKQGGQRELG